MSESWTSGRESASCAAIAVLVCGAACAAMWGFTVDDALISVRYARHLAAGEGWRFNSGGPATDGVTPLAWPIVLWPFAHADALTVLLRARVFGLIVHVAAIGFLGARIGALPARRTLKTAAILSLGACLPIAAHASSGMETALVTALATIAAASWDRKWAPAILVGMCASLRPEMIPWAAALAAGLAIASGASRARVAVAGAIAVVPAVVVARICIAAFGRPAPLAVLAKPSDLSHGAIYAGAALFVCATPALLAAPIALRRERGPALAIALAAIAHVLAVIAAGGDWMPYARLVAPIAPGLVVAFVLSAPHARPWSLAARGVVTALLGAWMWIAAAPSGRHVERDRAALIFRARPVLRDARLVACVDVGWVSAATDANILDLAGLTDPEIAALGGGHTSKRIDLSMLLDRDADVLLLYVDHVPADPSAWPRIDYARAVEARLAWSPAIAEHYGQPQLLPLGESRGYVVLRKTR